MYFALHDESLGGQVYLDLTGLSKQTWKQKLPDLRQEIMDYLSIDPAKKPVPVEPGIHYFMGGIQVDRRHQTNISNLYAAGECCCQYHGANRLGGNSLLGAIYGGRTAASTVLQNGRFECKEGQWNACISELPKEMCSDLRATPGLIEKTADILYRALGIVREGSTLRGALDEIKALIEANRTRPNELPRLYLAEAMLRSALARQESRGAHYRSDFPQRDEGEPKQTSAQYQAGRGQVSLTYCK
jgi:succinate dehydrogenase / fumarate reductase flavoprotein subunit